MANSSKRISVLISDPLDIKAESGKSRRKKCTDCSAIFDTHFELFHHQIESCKKSRDISIFKVNRNSQKSKRKTVPDVIDGSGTPQCTDCKEIFPTFRALNTHKRFTCKSRRFLEVESRKKFRCECGSKFTKPCNLKRHKDKGVCERVVQFNSSKMFYCVDCKIEFSTISNLKRHKLTLCPSGPKIMIQPRLNERFPCPDCGVSFTRRQNLLRHRRTVKCLEKFTTVSENADNDNDESDESED